MSDCLDREIAVAREAALAAGRVIARHAGGARRSWKKGEDSPVTRADLEANDAIVELLRTNFPGDAILSEETRDSPARFRHSRVWIVDPLDGTKEFIQRVPEYAVSVALSVDGRPAVGVVHQPVSGECFWGARGQGAFLGREPLRVSSRTHLAECTLLSSRTEMSRGQLELFRDGFAALQPVGSVALKLALTAAGRGDLWISMAPKSEWDVCAGDVLVREAGGVFVTRAEGERSYNQKEVALEPPMAAGPRVLIEQVHALWERQ